MVINSYFINFGLIDYVRACQNHTSLKFISISLFKYFDKKSCGSITFVDMIKAMIPGL